MGHEKSPPLGQTVPIAHARTPFRVVATRPSLKMRLSAKVSDIMSVTVTDSQGRKVSGLPVTFRLIRGSGTITNRGSETNDAGWAHTLLLPTKCGEHVVTCEAGGRRVNITCAVEPDIADAKPAALARISLVKAKAPAAAKEAPARGSVTPSPAEPPPPLPMFTLDDCRPVRPGRVSGETPMPVVTPAVLPNLTPPMGIPAMPDDPEGSSSAKGDLAGLKGNRRALITLLVCLLVGALIGILGYRLFTARDIPAGETIDCRESGWVDTGDRLVYQQCIVKRR